MSDDPETYAAWADEILLVSRHESNRMLPKDQTSSYREILNCRLRILRNVEALLRKAHDAGRRPT